MWHPREWPQVPVAELTAAGSWALAGGSILWNHLKDTDSLKNEEFWGLGEETKEWGLLKGSGITSPC